MEYIFLKALEKVMATTGVDIFNLGTGIRCSVLDVVKSFEKLTGKRIPYIIIDRRAGGIVKCYAYPPRY